ncbi:hypothetical protein F4677DRAFT_443031 [Hypoxylon crocopeplum]|nr:hypothetical protein F4677DRAFT_443031 [Hypoxylon crocopeplum]
MHRLQRTRRDPGVAFIKPPPSLVRVGETFQVKIRAPSSNDNGAFAFVTLGRVSVSLAPLYETYSWSQDPIQGCLSGSWQKEDQSSSGGVQFETIEFRSISINRPGVYVLKISLFSEPTFEDLRGTIASVEQIKDFHSDMFTVDA